MPENAATSEAVADLTEKVAELRRQLDGLTANHLKPAVSSAASVARAVVTDADRITAMQADKIAERVKESPLKALGIAAVVGFAIAAILR
jgi:ElaB/YqjD/DUF883 family membrane-anchored ribosome-binding protein